MLSVGIDITEMPEEGRFLNIVKKHQFKERRDFIKQAIALKSQLTQYHLEEKVLNKRIKDFYSGSV